MNDYEQYNPMLQLCEREDQLKIYDPELASKIKKTDFSNWSCCVCLENITFNINICFPFVCDHSICFNCFENICKTVRKDLRPKKVKCPLCRKLPAKDWLDKNKIKFEEYCHKDILFKITNPY